MDVRYNLIRDLMHRLGERSNLAVGHCDAELAERIEKLPIPMRLKRVFQWAWLTKSGHVGVYWLNSTQDVLSQQWSDLLIKAEMLDIGSARNGDELVLRFSNDENEVGFLNHVELAVAADEGKDPRDFYTKVCGSLDELLLRLVEHKYLPLDYWVATELNELKLDMQKDAARRPPA